MVRNYDLCSLRARVSSRVFEVAVMVLGIVVLRCSWLVLGSDSTGSCP